MKVTADSIEYLQNLLPKKEWLPSQARAALYAYNEVLAKKLSNYFDSVLEAY